MMHLYGVAKTEIEREMTAQFRETPAAELAIRRPGLITTIRSRLSADLRALAAAIEPHRPMTPQTGTPHR